MANPESAVNLDQTNRWSVYKNLLKVVNRAVSSKDVDDINDLESALRKHRADFLTLLKNPVSIADLLTSAFLINRFLI